MPTTSIDSTSVHSTSVDPTSVDSTSAFSHTKRDGHKEACAKGFNATPTYDPGKLTYHQLIKPIPGVPLGPRLYYKRNKRILKGEFSLCFDSRRALPEAKFKKFAKAIMGH